MNEKYKTLIDNYNNLETKLTKKRSKFDQLLKKSEAFSKENQLLCQFFDVLDSKDSEILKKFSLEFITTIEKTLLQCLDTLKLEKFLRNVSINLQTMGLDKYQEVFKATKDNRQLFLDFLRETQARKTEIDLKSLFFKEIAFKPITLSNSVQVEEKNLETSSMCSNFKELLSQINIKSDKNIDSFQTYFEKEHKKDLEISLETDIRPIEEPFESKLAELQRNFLEIKEKIKEKVSFYKDEKPSNEREDDHNEKSFDKIRDNSPMRGFSIQNKENLNFTRGDNNVKNRIIRKNQENQNSIKRNIVNANAFERHLEVLRNNNKN